MKKLAMLIAGTALLAFPGFAGAQDAEDDMTQPRMHENVEWVGAYFVKFKPMMMDRALEIIEDHFETVDEELGRPGPTWYRFMTGEWDMVVLFPMEGGPGDMEWEITEADAVWNQAFLEQEGSAEQAMQTFQQFAETVARDRFELAMTEAE